MHPPSPQHLATRASPITTAFCRRAQRSPGSYPLLLSVVTASLRAPRRPPACALHRSFPLLGVAALLSSPASSPRSSLSCSLRFASGEAAAADASAEDLLRAFHVLNLSPMSNDAEIKSAYHKFAKTHHPDAAAACTTGSGGGEDAKMISGTEAYQLLRRFNFDSRQRIIRSRQRGCGRESEEYSQADYEKAQRTYNGYARRTSSSSRRHEQDAFNEEFFGPPTHEGQTRTAAFNQYHSRVERLRRQNWQGSPPWRFSDRVGGDGRDSEDSQDASARGGASQGSRGGVAGLRFFLFGNSQEALRRIRKLQAEAPGFAGMDGSKYNSEANAARAGPIIDANPSLRDYLLMRQRAQERAIVDHALERPLFIALTVLTVCMMVLMGAAAYRSFVANKAYQEALRRREEEQGGG